MKALTLAERKVFRIISKTPSTYGEIENRLDDVDIDVPGVVRSLREKKKVKNIIVGPRSVYFAYERQRKVADIKSLGKYALDVYKIVNEEGPQKGRDLISRFGVNTSYLAHSLDNLVSSGYLNRIKGTQGEGGGHLYYNNKTNEEELRIKMLSPREKRAYEIFKEKGRPLKSINLVTETGWNQSHVVDLLMRMVEKGILYYKKESKKGVTHYKQGLTHFPIYFIDSKHEEWATIISVSPKHAELIYSHLSRRPKLTNDLARLTGLDTKNLHSVLVRFRKEGLVCSCPDKAGSAQFGWYLPRNAPTLPS